MRKQTWYAPKCHALSTIVFIFVWLPSYTQCLIFILADFAVFSFHVVVLWSDMLGSVQCWEDPLPRSASS